MAWGIVGAVGLGIGLFSLFVAIALPLRIEQRKRPSFRFKVAKCTVIGPVKYLHVTVINEPIKGCWGRWLIRNTATAAVASLNYEEAPIPSGKCAVWGVPARWSARPEPWDKFRTVTGRWIYEISLPKLAQCFRLDVEPSDDGEVVIVAMKHEGDAAAYAHSRASFDRPAFANEQRAPSLLLPGKEYRLTLVVRAGGLVHSQDFRVLNRDATHEGFRIEICAPKSPAHRASKATLREFVKAVKRCKAEGRAPDPEDQVGQEVSPISQR